MSRRKQTKPFKVEDKPEIKKERKLKPRRILPKTEEQGLSQNYPNSVSFNDAEESIEGDAMRPKRGPKCNDCGKVLASTLSLARHKLTHSEKKPYRCPKCGAGFKTSSNMHRHLRIHFREMNVQSDSKPVINMPRSSTQRSPRQNIRTPNKFREFDVDLVGVGPRSTSDTPTYVRAYSKAKDPLRVRKQVVRPSKTGEGVYAKGGSSLDVSEDPEKDELPDLNVPRVRRSITSPEDLVCHLCHKTFISKFGLLTHIMSHSDTSTDSAHKCNLCDQSFTTPKGLIVHNVIAHKIAKHKEEGWKRERSFQEISIIDFSATKFPDVAEVACSKSHCSPPLRDAQHIFLCKKCDQAFPLLEALKIHMNKAHNKKVERHEHQKSEICTFLASLNLQNKEENGSTQHGEQESFSVENGIDDDNMFTSKSVAMEDTPSWLRLQPNMTETCYRKETDVIPVRPELNFFKRIPLLTNSDSSALVPVEYMSGPLAPLRSTPHSRRRTRNQVDSTTLLKNIEPTLRPVENEKGEKNIFWCRICNYSSREKSALVRHLLTHSGIRPYFCKICDYAFTTKANCERHVRKRHNCVEKSDLDAAVRCDWEMLKKAPREDIYMISGSSSACPVCSESFGTNEDLKLHLKIHEERHFLCQLCNVRCTTRNNCVRHILHKHPGIPHQEANNIITFVGNGKNDLDMDNFEDIVQDKPDIDISKGRIGGKRPAKPLRDWPKSTFRNPRSLPGNLSHKKPRIGAPSTNNPEPSNVADDQESMSLPESEEWIENREEYTRRPVKCIPLIPLLKIKAYNEAAARSYADMVVLYQHLNFLNSAENDMMAMDDTIMPMMESPPRLDGEEDFANGETMFICQSCGNSFNTEDELNSHIVLCESDADETSDQIDNNTRLMMGSDDNGNDDHSRNVFLTDAATDNARMGVKGRVNGGRTNLKNRLDMPGLEDSLGAQVYDTIKNPLVGWPNHSVTNSPFSIKCAEDGTVLDYDSPYTNERPIPISSSTYNKESSYVEDSLLMTMFEDEDTDGIFEGNDSTIGNSQIGIMSRYSSSLPTMVNMESPTMAAMKFQGGSNVNSQLDDPNGIILPTNSKGKMHTGRKCPQCSKVFPWASSLRRHIMTHTGLKLYMCRLCKMRFTTRSNLIRHVYRRHGMAKQHPDFASCLAKLHPSDALLREVEADVRRRIDFRKKRKPTPGGDENLGGTYDHDDDAESSGKRRNKGVTNDFQSMLEEDPDTLLVDLDYSPRDELIGMEDKKPSPVTESAKPSEEKVKSIEGSKILAIEAPPPTTPTTEEPSDGNEPPTPVEEATATTTEEPAEKSAEESEVCTVKIKPQLATEDPAPISSVTTTDMETNPKKLRCRSKTKSIDAQTSTKTPSSAKNSPQSPKILKETKEKPKTLKEMKGELKTLNETKEKPKILKETKEVPKILNEIKEEPKTLKETKDERGHPKPKSRTKQSSQYVCGLCKKIFKTVPDLISHLDDHNVPHCWHCSICTVPFTNKYNCQRHLTRRHGRADLEPLYVEDLKYGPRNPKGQIRKSNSESNVKASK